MYATRLLNSRQKAPSFQTYAIAQVHVVRANSRLPPVNEPIRK